MLQDLVSDSHRFGFSHRKSSLVLPVRVSTDVQLVLLVYICGESMSRSFLFCYKSCLLLSWIIDVHKVVYSISNFFQKFYITTTLFTWVLGSHCSHGVPAQNPPHRFGFSHRKSSLVQFDFIKIFLNKSCQLAVFRFHKQVSDNYQ